MDRSVTTAASQDSGYTPAQADQGPSLDTYKRLFTEARDMTAPARRRSLIYSRYYHGKQLDDRARRLLERRKEPTFSINRVRPGVEGMVGVVEKGKSDPRAYPRNGPDEAASEVATDCLRYISDANRWSAIKLKAFRNELVEGTAAVIIEVDTKLEVKLRRIRWEEFFYDPYSREEDFSDASYMGVAKWQHLDAVVGAYPEFKGQLQTICSQGDVIDATWQDRPDSLSASTTWSDPRRKRLLTVEMYHRYGGQWLRCVFVGGLKLEEGVSPYLDNDSEPCCPIEAQSAFVDDENARYGVVEDMMGPQDEINVYRRKAAWLATFRQLQETDPSSASIDPDEARKEAARPDGVIPSGWNVVDNTGRFSMDISLLQEAKGEIERIGPNPALLARGNATSGRQDLIRQQAGLTELAHLYSGLDDFEHRVFKQAWARIRQYWTEPKMIRVTDDEDDFRFMQINEPQWGPPAPVLDPATGMPKFDPVTRQIVMQPQFMGYKNSPAQIDVDIIIDSTPDTANVQQEQYAQLVELAKVGGLGPNPGPMLLRASSLPHKREIMEELDKAQQAPPSPAEELDLAGKKATVDKLTGQAAEAHARAAQIASEAGGDGQDPLSGMKAIAELHQTQASVDKTFAQAGEARARADKMTAETHAGLFSPPQGRDAGGQPEF